MTSRRASVPPVEAPSKMRARGSNWRTGAGGSRSPGTGAAARAWLRADVAEGGGAAGFAQHVEGPEPEGFEGVFGTALREGAHDNHRDGPALHEDFEEGEAVHARHLDVQRDDVGVEFLDLVAGGVGIDGGADDLDFGVSVERIGRHAADHGGVVDDEDADFGHGNQVPGVRR
jgi:hypothetical protein